MSLRRRISRLVALLRYHRTRQFAWRLYRIAQRQWRKRIPARFVFSPSGVAATWKPNARTAFARIADHRFQLWPLRSAFASEMAEGNFRYLNQARNLGGRSADSEVKIDWNPDMPRLWRFHLHCQEDLLELAEEKGARSAFQLIECWIRDPSHQSPLNDPDAWHPFCISRRLPVWLALASKYEPPPEYTDSFWKSIADQVDWLRKNCEWDLGGNHLFENLAALYLVETFLDVGEAKGHFSTELMLLQQLDEQILRTGEHCERTPTYHGLMMVCVLQCIEAASFVDSPSQEALCRSARRMTEFARWLRQPDGQFPLLSDSVREETPDLEKLFAWADELVGDKEPRLDTAFDASPDYWMHQTNKGDRIVFDTGPLACDHLPAHGHADLLQVTATIAGRDAIVDTGNFQYEPGVMRAHCRSTAAHNVMQLDEREHCDVWSSFRMGRRGHPIGFSAGKTGEFDWCSAVHDGFGCPTGRIVVGCNTSWTVVDWCSQIDGHFRAKSRLHWHPDWQLKIDGSGARLTTKSATVWQKDAVDRLYRIERLQPTGSLVLEDGFHCPSFGEKIPNQILVNQVDITNEGWLGVYVSLDPSEAPWRPVVSMDGASALRVGLRGGESIVLSMKDGSLIG